MANPVPIPYQTPIAKIPKATGGIARGKGGRGLGGPERPHTDPYENFCTQPWIKWFQFIQDNLFTVQEQGDSTGDPWDYDFSSVDFYSNAPGPGGAFTGQPPFVTQEPPEPLHPGITGLQTDVNIGDITSMWLPPGPSQYGLPAAPHAYVRYDQITSARFVVKTPPTITTCRFEFGLSTNPNGNWAATVFESGTDAIYFFYDTNVDNALRLKTIVGSVAGPEVVIVNPCPADTWLDATLTRTQVTGGFDLDIRVNGADFGPLGFATLPTDSTEFGTMARIGTRVAAARKISVDRITVRRVDIGDRFTVTL